MVIDRYVTFLYFKGYKMDEDYLRVLWEQFGKCQFVVLELEGKQRILSVETAIRNVRYYGRDTKIRWQIRTFWITPEDEWKQRIVFFNAI